MKVEFDEQNNFQNVGNLSPKGITGWLIKKGIVKDVKNAQYVLIVIMIICFGLTGYILMKDNDSVPQQRLSPQELRELPEPIRRVLEDNNN